MSSGIHVTNLPDGITEKQLKVFFSNPKNGGGRVKQILHPLPHDSAVVLFESSRTVQDIVSKQQVLGEQRLSVKPLPKQIFGKITVELEKNASHYIERNSPVVDELQYIADLKVEFSYETEIYILKGNWYQLEWALHYLDRLLEDGDLDRKPKNRDSRDRPRRQDNDDMTEDPLPQIKHEIKKPNIPMVRKTHAYTNEKTGKKEAYEQPGKHSDLQGNLDSKRREKKQYKDDTDDYKRNRKTEKHRYVNQLGDPGSEEENYGAYHTVERHKNQHGKSITFTKETNFSENKPRPTRQVVTAKRTRGLDIAQADLVEAFGEAPLRHTFTMPNDLKVEVTLDDITKQDTDGIINPTTPDLSSLFGPSIAIVQAAGYEMHAEMQEYLSKVSHLDLAQVMHTKAGGSLHRKVTCVLHTASPRWIEDDSDRATHFLVCTYINCFMYADSRLWLQSLATPVISAGAFGFPLDVCIQAFYDALLLFSVHGQQTTNHLKEIRLICFDENTSMAAIAILQSLLDCDNKQAISAATERYNSRCNKSNFGAENLSTEAVNRAEKTRTQQKNKNTAKHTKKETNYEKEKSRANKKKSEDASKANTNTDDSDDDKNKKKKSSSFTSDKKEAEKTVINKEQVEDVFDSHISSQRSNCSDDDDDAAENRGRRSLDFDSSDTKLDLKKSMLMEIDRPKIRADPDGEDGDGDDAGGFGVGLMDADKYIKKCEDLVSENRTVDEEDGREENDIGQAYEETTPSELKQEDKEEEKQVDYQKAEKAGQYKAVNVEDENREDLADNVREESRETLGGAYKHDELDHNEDPELRQAETDMDEEGFKGDESKYEFIGDAEISAALDRELGIDSILAAKGREDAENPITMIAKDEDCEDGDEESLEPYTGPKVLED